MLYTTWILTEYPALPPLIPPYKGGIKMDWLPPLALSERLRQVQGEGWGGVVQGVTNFSND